MPTSPAVISLYLSLGAFNRDGGVNPSSLQFDGIGQAGDSLQVIEEATQQPILTTTVQANGSWSVSGPDYLFASKLIGRLDYHVVDASTGAVSASVGAFFGTTAAETITGPTLGATITGPTYLIGQNKSLPTSFVGSRAGDSGFVYYTPPAGNDTFVAYTVSPDAGGHHAQGAEVSITGGTGTGDTVVLPVSLGALEEHHAMRDPAGTQVRLALETADATVDIAGVERLQFSDVTLTVQSDPLVDFLYYDTRYPDIAVADLNVRAHYDAAGWHEGRDPNALFSTQGYLSAYGDVRGAGLNPLGHYDTMGWKEGRDPSAAFDTKLYLTFNPDVAKSGMDPLVHYLNFGIEEGRKSSPVVESTLVKDGFDPLYYKLANADVGLSGLDTQAHYDQFGWKEGRNPDAFFDTNWYLAHNADVKAAGIDPLEHYEAFGWKEGRDPSTHFDTGAYLAANPDVAASGMSPLQHFLQFGAAEGRSGFGDLY